MHKISYNTTAICFKNKFRNFFWKVFPTEYIMVSYIYPYICRTLFYSVSRHSKRKSLRMYFQTLKIKTNSLKYRKKFRWWMLDSFLWCATLSSLSLLSSPWIKVYKHFRKIEVNVNHCDCISSYSFGQNLMQSLNLWVGCPKGMRVYSEDRFLRHLFQAVYITVSDNFHNGSMINDAVVWGYKGINHFSNNYCSKSLSGQNQSVKLFLWWKQNISYHPMAPWRQYIQTQHWTGVRFYIIHRRESFAQ